MPDDALNVIESHSKPGKDVFQYSPNMEGQIKFNIDEKDASIAGDNYSKDYFPPPNCGPDLKAVDQSINPTLYEDAIAALNPAEMRESKIVMCNKGGMVLSNSSNLTAHIRHRHEGLARKKFGKKPCPHCNKILHVHYLKTHIRQKHEGVPRERKKKPCPHCGKNLTARYLQSHIRRRHEGVLPH